MIFHTADTLLGDPGLLIDRSRLGMRHIINGISNNQMFTAYKSPEVLDQNHQFRKRQAYHHFTPSTVDIQKVSTDLHAYSDTVTPTGPGIGVNVSLSVIIASVTVAEEICIILTIIVP